MNTLQKVESLCLTLKADSFLELIRLMILTIRLSSSMSFFAERGLQWIVVSNSGALICSPLPKQIVHTTFDLVI